MTKPLRREGERPPQCPACKRLILDRALPIFCPHCKKRLP